MALKDWEDVRAFSQDAQSSHHYDVVYILHKLLGEKAFHFTAMPVMVGLHVTLSLDSLFFM